MLVWQPITQRDATDLVPKLGPPSSVDILVLVPTLNPGPFDVRVTWDTGTSKAIRGKHEEEAFFRGANQVRIGAGIDRRDDRGDLSAARDIPADF